MVCLIYIENMLKSPNNGPSRNQSERQSAFGKALSEQRTALLHRLDKPHSILSGPNCNLEIHFVHVLSRTAKSFLIPRLPPSQDRDSVITPLLAKMRVSDLLVHYWATFNTPKAPTTNRVDQVECHAA